MAKQQQRQHQQEQMEEAWTFMLGTDYQLPEGYQLATGVDQVTNVQVPFGAMGGHVLIVRTNQRYSRSG